MKPKLALFEFRMIGDAVMALPFIRSVQEQYDVFVCCTPAGREVFRMVLPEEKILCWRPPWVDEVAKYSPSKLLRQYPGELLRHLNALKIQIGVSGWADPRSSLIMLMAGITRRIGFDLQPQNYYGHERPWRAAGLRKARIFQQAMKAIHMSFLTESLKRESYLQHHVQDWGQLCWHIGEEWCPEYPWLKAPASLLPDDLVAFIQEQQELGLPLGIIHCGARTEAKRWPVERFRELVENFFIPRSDPVILIDLPESPAPQIIHPLVRRFRPPSVDAYVALSALADYALCNDTGAAHLSAATGNPVVTIFSNSRSEWFAPYGNGELAVEGSYCPHKPCLERCVMPSYICRDGVSVEAVKEKLVACLSGMPR